MIAAPEPLKSRIEIESLGSSRIEETSLGLLEDRSGKGHSSAETETGLVSHHLGDQSASFDVLAMSIVRGPDYKSETFDESRLWLERTLETELDWYPLPPIKQPVRLSQSRLVWTVSTLQIH